MKADNGVLCSIADCDRPVRTRTCEWCDAHYMKNYRYGTPTPVHNLRRHDLHDRRFGLLHVLEPAPRGWLCRCECGREVVVHTGSLLRPRSPSRSCGDRRHRWISTPSYGAAHERVSQYRGRAAEHPCHDCGGEARQWSYTHNDPDELTQLIDDTLVAYSPNIDAYEPRCVPCHKAFDLSRLDAARSELRLHALNPRARVGIERETRADLRFL